VAHKRTPGIVRLEEYARPRGLLFGTPRSQNLPMGYVHRYTEHEVAKILKDSEGSAVGGGAGQGHAEGLHELQAVGRDRAHTTVFALSDRVLDERKSNVGAFDGCQVQAVACALNTRAGQNTLMVMSGTKVNFVFAEIDVSAQGFKMKAAMADVPAIGPIELPVVQAQTVAMVCMKLIPVNGVLHIRTAYPRASASARGEHCEVYYLRDGGFPQQNVPI
jgi:hypothetical protein